MCVKIFNFPISLSIKTIGVLYTSLCELRLFLFGLLPQTSEDNHVLGRLETGKNRSFRLREG